MTPERLDWLTRWAGTSLNPGPDELTPEELRELLAAARREAALREAWDAVSAAIDDTHPEGHPCDICDAADDLDDLFDEVPQ